MILEKRKNKFQKNKRVKLKFQRKKLRVFKMKLKKKIQIKKFKQNNSMKQKKIFLNWKMKEYSQINIIKPNLQNARITKNKRNNFY